MTIFKVNYKIQSIKTGRFSGEGVVYTSLPVSQIESEIDIEILNPKNQVCLIDTIQRIKGEILT